MANWKDIEAREARRIEYEQALQARLEGLGVQFRRATFTGDSSYPVEYTLRYSFVEAAGPTFDLALVEFIERLLRHVPVEKALEADYDPAILDERNPFTPPAHDAIHQVESYRRILEAGASLDDPTGPAT